MRLRRPRDARFRRVSARALRASVTGSFVGQYRVLQKLSAVTTAHSLVVTVTWGASWMVRKTLFGQSVFACPAISNGAYKSIRR
jgi:hypothetical protein